MLNRLDRRRLGAEMPLILAVATAAVIRGWGLDHQILAGDEWHSIQNNFVFGYHAVTQYFRGLAAISGGFGAATIRLPFFLAGVATVWLFPLWLRRYFDRSTANLAAWLLCLSPLHVFYSRLARPYAIIALLALAAVFALQHWTETRRLGFAALYALSAGLVSWLHPVALPTVFAPLLLYGLQAVVRPQKHPRLPALALPALLAAAAAALPIAAQLRLSPSGLLGIPRLEPVTIGTFFEAWRLFSGLNGIAWAAVFLGLVMIGIWAALRRARGLTLALGAVCIAQIGTIAAIGPEGSQGGLFFARFTFPLLPIFLLFAAQGAMTTVEGAARSFLRISPSGGRLAGGTVLCALMLVGGPLPSVHWRYNNWIANDLLTRMLRAESVVALLKNRVSPWYAQLAEQGPGRLRIVECPIRINIDAMPFPAYQQVHRQWNLIGLVDRFDLPETSSLARFSGVQPGRLPSFAVPVDSPSALAQSGADYVVVHTRLAVNLRPADRSGPARWVDWFWPGAPACLDYLRSVYGEPVYTDGAITVFDVRTRGLSTAGLLFPAVSKPIRGFSPCTTTSAR